MPNCDFFAAGPDHRAVLEFIFGDGKCEVYENQAAPGCSSPKKFSALHELEEHYGINDWRASDDWHASAQFSMLLQLHPHGASGRLCIDNRVRGWGLVQLYLSSPREGRLARSHTNHNSEKRAHKWSDNYRDRLGSPSEWNWAVVTSFSSRLNRAIRKMSVAKIGSRVVLAYAAKLRQQGMKLSDRLDGVEEAAWSLMSRLDSLMAAAEKEYQAGLARPL